MEITIINILVLLVAFIIALFGVFKENREAKDFNRLKVLIILIFLGLVLSTLSEIKKYKNELSEKELRDSQYISVIHRSDTTLKRVNSNLNISDSILNNTGTSINQLTDVQHSAGKLNDSLSKEIRIQLETNLEAKRILLRSKQSASLIEKSLNEQTGGNSFCRADIRLLYMGDNKWDEMISLWNDSDFSLRNVHVEIEKPYYAFSNNRKGVFNEPWVMPPLKDEYFVAKHSKVVIYQGIVPDSLLKRDELVYHITFFLGNGSIYTQAYKFRMRNGVPVPATKINQTTNSAYKYEYIHPLYPQKPVNWNYMQPLMPNTFRN